MSNGGGVWGTRSAHLEKTAETIRSPQERPAGIHFLSRRESRRLRDPLGLCCSRWDTPPGETRTRTPPLGEQVLTDPPVLRCRGGVPADRLRQRVEGWSLIWELRLHPPTLPGPGGHLNPPLKILA